eukprot:3362287-Amphidinium_carterae.2
MGKYQPCCPEVCHSDLRIRRMSTASDPNRGTSFLILPLLALWRGCSCTLRLLSAVGALVDSEEAGETKDVDGR